MVCTSDSSHHLMSPDVVAAVVAPVLLHAHPVPLGDVPGLDHVVDGGGQTWVRSDFRVQPSKQSDLTETCRIP